MKKQENSQEFNKTTNNSNESYENADTQGQKELNSTDNMANEVDLAEVTLGGEGLIFVMTKNSTYEVGSKNFCGEVLEIPKNFQGVEVTGIIESGFSESHSIRKVIFPPGIQSIKRGAFSNCINLEQIEFMSNSKIQEVQAGAFFNCIKLFKVVFPRSIKVIGANAFCGCSALKRVNFGWFSKLKYVGDEAFKKSGLEFFSLPIEVSYLGKGAFSGCRQLTNVVYNEYSVIERICEDTFRDCDMLLEVIIPRSVKVICSGSFTNCVSLDNIEFDEDSGLCEIESQAIVNCPKLEKIVFGGKLQKICSQAIVNCTELIRVTINAQKPPEIWQDSIKGHKRMRILVGRKVYEKYNKDSKYKCYDVKRKG